MARQRRVGIELGDIYNQIEAMDHSPVWERLPMAQKVRLLLEDRLKQNFPPGQVPDSLSNPSVLQFLKQLEQGQYPSDQELRDVERDWGIDRLFLKRLCDLVLQELSR